MIKWYFEPRKEHKTICARGLHVRKPGERGCSICNNERIRKQRLQGKPKRRVTERSKMLARYITLALLFTTSAHSQVQCTTDGLFCLGDFIRPAIGSNGLIPKLTPGGDDPVPDGTQPEDTRGTVTSVSGIFVQTKWANGVIGWTSDSTGTIAKVPGVNISMPASYVVPYSPEAFDFTLGPIPDLTMYENDGAVFTVEVKAERVAGVQVPVTFSIAGLPDGATAEFNPLSCLPPCSAIMTITIPPKATL